MMAAFRSGIRVTPINWHLTGEEIGYIVDNCDAEIFLAEGQMAHKAVEAAGMAPQVVSLLSIDGDIDGFSSYLKVIEQENDENIAEPVHGGGMLYTSGTTGRPKGVYRKERPPTLPNYSEIGYQKGNEASDTLARELIDFARERLPAFKCPRSVAFVDTLPRLPTGKIMRRTVREPYWEGRDKSI